MKTITFEVRHTERTHQPDGYRCIVTEMQPAGDLNPADPTKLIPQIVDIAEAYTLEHLQEWCADQDFPADTIIVPFDPAAHQEEV